MNIIYKSKTKLLDKIVWRHLVQRTIYALCHYSVVNMAPGAAPSQALKEYTFFSLKLLLCLQ